jgi:hypothetical protein
MTSSTATKALIVAMGAAMADAFTVPLQGVGMVASVAARRPLLLCGSAGNAGGHMQGQPHGGTRQNKTLGRATLPAVRMNMKGDNGESHSPQVDAALQTSHPLIRKRFVMIYSSCHFTIQILCFPFVLRFFSPQGLHVLTLSHAWRAHTTFLPASQPLPAAHAHKIKTLCRDISTSPTKPLPAIAPGKTHPRGV